MSAEQHAASVAGCWLTAGWDMNWYDVTPHACEMDALRYAAKEPYLNRSVFFVPWGEVLHDRHHIAQLTHIDGSGA